MDMNVLWLRFFRSFFLSRKDDICVMMTTQEGKLTQHRGRAPGITLHYGTLEALRNWTWVSIAEKQWPGDRDSSHKHLELEKREPWEGSSKAGRKNGPQGWKGLMVSHSRGPQCQLESSDCSAVESCFHASQRNWGTPWSSFPPGLVSQGWSSGFERMQIKT